MAFTLRAVSQPNLMQQRYCINQSKVGCMASGRKYSAAIVSAVSYGVYMWPTLYILYMWPVLLGSLGGSQDNHWQVVAWAEFACSVVTGQPSYTT